MYKSNPFRILFHDLVPEEGFVIPISVGVTAITVVIIHCYIDTAINSSIRTDIIDRRSLDTFEMEVDKVFTKHFQTLNYYR